MTATCNALAANAKCMNGYGCWPAINVSKTYPVFEVNLKETCAASVVLLDRQWYSGYCPSTACDSGSMATPMVSLFAVIAATFYKLM
jgi:hypothetical protein